jgi:hypothetical protein
VLGVRFLQAMDNAFLLELNLAGQDFRATTYHLPNLGLEAENQIH